MVHKELAQLVKYNIVPLREFVMGNHCVLHFSIVAMPRKKRQSAATKAKAAKQRRRRVQVQDVATAAGSPTPLPPAAQSSPRRRRTGRSAAYSVAQQKRRHTRDASRRLTESSRTRTVYALNQSFRRDWKQRMRQKYTGDTAFRRHWQHKMCLKYSTNAAYRFRWRHRMRTARQAGYTSQQFRTKWRERLRTRYSQDRVFRDAWRKKMQAKYAAHAAFREAWREKMREKMRHDPRVKERVKHTRTRRSVAQNSNADVAIAAFTSHIQEGPVYACVSCHRHLYKQTVITFTEAKYKQQSCQEMLVKMVAAFGSALTDERRHICRTCHSYLTRAKMPPQAAINGLLLDDVPPSLQLTDLEAMLAAQRILFMRLMALPRGRQRAIHGAVVNVPSNVSTTVTSLPLTPTQAGLIPLKLKRRLRYKGYVTHQFIRPAAVLQALDWLVQNNVLYCGIDVDQHWIESCIEEDVEVWNGITGSAETDDPQPAADTDSDVEPSDSDSDSEDLTAKVRGLKFSTCLQPSDPQYAATELSIAPAEGQVPLDFMLDTNAEILAFPAKYPFARGGLTDERDVTLTPKKYFIQRVLNKDKRFASDANYLFFAQYVTETKSIRDNITVAMRKTAGRVSAGAVANASQLRQLIKCDNAYHFLQNVRGSPAYLQRAVRELIAMVAQVGCPQFFLTLSAADMSWTEVFKMIARQNGRTLSDDDIAALSYEDKASMLRDDPVLTARHFDHRLKAFFSDILTRGSTLGPLKTHFYRIEFQMRGSPHAHCLLWTADGPDMTAASSDEIVAYFADKIVGQLPPETDDLRPVVERLQRHSHSVACRKKKSVCQFRFPRPPSDRTLLASPPSAEQDAAAIGKWQADILTRVHEALDQLEDTGTLTLDDVLEQVGVSSEDYHAALSINVKGRSLVLQRGLGDLFINNYNTTILLAWRANSDIQPVLDRYACIMYIVSYITKDEREMGEILRAAKREHADKDVKTQLKKIGSTFLTHREAVFRLLGLTMLSCSVKRVFVPTDMPENRVRLLKANRHLASLDPDSEDVYMLGLIQRYTARPTSLDALCLADFAVEYDVCYKRAVNDADDDVQPTDLDQQQQEESSANVVRLSGGMGKMRHRKSRSILLTHRYSKDNEPEKHYHAELMLYTAWRDEQRDLLASSDTYSEAYVDRRDEIAAVKTKFYRQAEAVADAVDEFFDNGPPVSAWDGLAPGERQENEMCAEEGAVPENFVD